MLHNMHNEKYALNAVVGIRKEQFRELEQDQYRNNVDLKQSHRNIYDELSEDGNNWFKRITEAREKTKELTGKAVRANTVVICSTVESVPNSWGNEVAIQYFRDKAKWYENYLKETAGLDENCFLSLVVHLDETNPHATYVFVPQKDGRLQCKNVMTKQVLQGIQTEGQRFAFDWIESYQIENRMILEPLEQSMAGSKREHLNEFEYKRQQIETDTNNLKDQVKALEIQRDGIIEMGNEEIAKLEEKINEKMNAPDPTSYQELQRENKQLKETLSFKEKVIAQLEDTANYWKEQALHFKQAFEDVSKRIGARLMRFFGYDSVSPTNEYPDTDTLNETNQIAIELSIRNHKDYHVIEDQDNKGMYSVVFRKKDGEYERVDRNLSRDEAMDTVKSLQQIDRSENVTMKMH